MAAICPGISAPVLKGRPETFTDSWFLYLQQNIAAFPDRLRNPTLTTPGNLQDGDFWVEASGTTPTRTVTLNLRDNGATVILLSFVY